MISSFVRRPWKEWVDLAAECLKLGCDDIWLGETADAPWEYVVDLTPAGSRRLDLDTAIQFHAKHPSGLTFRWEFRLEKPAAPGRYSYLVDVDGCASVLKSLPAPEKKKFVAFLAGCEKAVLAKAQEFRAAHDDQVRMAQQLNDVMTMERSK